MSLTLEQAFQILEVPSTATWEDVRQAYREMVKVWHPDRFQEDAKFQARATKKIQDINAAYQILEKHFESPQPIQSTASPKTADEMFNRWADDKQRQSQSNASIPAGQSFPKFTTLEDLARYFSFNLPYYVYPCHLERSNNQEITPKKAVRISIIAVAVVGALTWLLDLPSNLMVVVITIAFSLMVVEWLCKKLTLPDALIFTQLGVTIVEGINRNDNFFTATIGHTYLYEHLSNLKWDEEEVSFIAINSIKFTFKPTRKEALTVPDTKWFKHGVYSTAHVIAHFQKCSQ